MQCAAVLGITFVDPGGTHGGTLDQDAELKECTKLLEQKYGSRKDSKYLSANGLRKDADNPLPSNSVVAQLGDLDAVKKLSAAWADDETRKKAGVGLYIQMHATQYYWGVPPANLARFVAMLYQSHDLRFRKINLSACDTAGRAGSPDPSQSLTMTFCNELSKTLKDHTDWLRGAMVAAYRGVVTFETDKRGEVHNVINHKPISPAMTFDKLGKQGQKSTIEQLSESAKTKTAKVMFKEIPSKLSQDPESKALFQQAKAYIGTKIAWKFVGNAWQRISLAEYTDRADMRTMITQLHTIHKGTDVGAMGNLLVKWGFVL